MVVETTYVGNLFYLLVSPPFPVLPPPHTTPYIYNT